MSVIALSLQVSGTPFEMSQTTSSPSHPSPMMKPFSTRVVFGWTNHFYLKFLGDRIPVHSRDRKWLRWRWTDNDRVKAGIHSGPDTQESKCTLKAKLRRQNSFWSISAISIRILVVILSTAFTLQCWPASPPIDGCADRALLWVLH